MIEPVAQTLIPIGDGERIKFGDIKRFQPIPDPKKPGVFNGLEIEMSPDNDTDPATVYELNAQDAEAAYSLLTEIEYVQTETIKALAQTVRQQTATATPQPGGPQ